MPVIESLTPSPSQSTKPGRSAAASVGGLRICAQMKKAKKSTSQTPPIDTKLPEPKQIDFQETNSRKEKSYQSIQVQRHSYGIGECWFEGEETRIENVVFNPLFWFRIFQYFVLPLAVLNRIAVLNGNLEALRSDPSSQKLAGIWVRKLVSCAAAWIALFATGVLWAVSGHDVSNVSDHVLRNISTVLPSTQQNRAVYDIQCAGNAHRCLCSLLLCSAMYRLYVHWDFISKATCSATPPFAR
jgi:hypothetical protein